MYVFIAYIYRYVHFQPNYQLVYNNGKMIKFNQVGLLIVILSGPGPPELAWMANGWIWIVRC